ncbi:iron-containing redox enzyme family protein [Candidatus Peregrinibacteria bacterium]|nr:iron-containing redox enzyme family protein [Candidatus Peregrinibacteria bacterium]MBI3816496.1 iron-containing redox enzyme family protein [Candidatus Peregrinibacteria bacterium]
MTSLTALDDLITSRSLLKHPFYLRWSAGELTLKELRTYAKEYFRLIERIPGIVARVRERTEDKALRLRIAENQREEQQHVELWKRFARSLGVSEFELLSHHASSKTEAAIRTLEAVAEKDFGSGAAAMYALELELPKIAATKKDGLCRFYGLTSEDAHAYFDEHLNEEEHLQVWRAIEVDAKSAEASCDASLCAQHEVLDAVCEACGIALQC